MDQEQLGVGAARRNLAAAQHARLAAGRPRPAPAWYFFAIGALMVPWLGAVDAARAWRAPWVFAIAGILFCFGVGVAVGVVVRQGGVVPRLRGPLLRRSIYGTLACAAVAGAVLAAGLVADFVLAGTAAGLVMATLFVFYGRRINRRLAASTPHQ